MRHGDCGAYRLRGVTDDPLTPRGWEQMWAAVSGERPWSVILTSRLRRCAAFGAELAQSMGVPWEAELRLGEIDLGEWEGRGVVELFATSPGRVAAMWRDPSSHMPPGGEPLSAFRTRVLAAWDEHTRRHAGKHILCITHGGVIRVILGHILGIPDARLLRLAVPEASVSRVVLDGDSPAPIVEFIGGRL
jgi:alpha-ribazole phosphatase/probable phosphoglycerate mutase